LAASIAAGKSLVQASSGAGRTSQALGQGSEDTHRSRQRLSAKESDVHEGFRSSQHRLAAKNSIPFMG
jgi:hypothetical protein